VPDTKTVSHKETSVSNAHDFHFPTVANQQAIAAYKERKKGK